jgi:hypothetical protein
MSYFIERLKELGLHSKHAIAAINLRRNLVFRLGPDLIYQSNFIGWLAKELEHVL